MTRVALGAFALLVGALWLPLTDTSTSARETALVTGKGVPYQPLTQPRPPAVKPPNDPLFAYQWNLPAIQVPAAWAVSRGAGATVAVLDTGVAYENRGAFRKAPDLAGTRFVAGRDFVDNDAHPDDIAPSDGSRSHGTQMASLIAETANNGIGASGVAPGAAIMPIRVLRPDGSGSPETIARGLRFAADHGANVANLSFELLSDAPVLRRAIDYAAAKGVTIVAAAGNDGTAKVSFPAAYAQVIAVGAVARYPVRAGYSSYGRALDLVAPAGAGNGEDNGYGPPDGVLAQTLKGGPSEFCYCFTASTSAAAAEVSGVAALVIASRRATTPSQVRQALLASAREVEAPGWDPQYGAGVVQAWGALAAANELRAVRSSSSTRGSSGSGSIWVIVVAVGAVAALAALGLLRLRRHGG